MLYAWVDWARNETERAISMGEAKIKRDSSAFLTRVEMIVFLFGECSRPPSSPDSVSLLDVSSAGSGTRDRSKVSGRKRTTSIPRTMNPILMVIGTNELFFMRNQENGMAATLAIK
jgi:hypothetical protein